MAKRRTNVTYESIERKIKDGRGQGEGENYKPWLMVQDVPSDGFVHRIQGNKINRTHHLMSNGELSLFLILDFISRVLDIREQYPLLPLEETMEIAANLGIRHPTIPGTEQPIVMTTDFMVTVSKNQATEFAPLTFKPVNQLSDIRILEKLEIERIYYQRRGHKLQIVTPAEIPKPLFNNLNHLHSYFRWSDRNISEQDFSIASQLLTNRVLNEQIPLRSITSDCDKRIGLPAGTSLSIAQHLIATRQWIVDLTIPLNPGKPLALLGPFADQGRS